MQQKTTRKRAVERIAANIDPALAALMDAERQRLGQCSRATIVRLALMDRYQQREEKKQEVA